MDDHSIIIQKARDNYSSGAPWPEDDAWHTETFSKIQRFVTKTLKRFCTSATIILNAGSGGTTYDTEGHFIHLDLVDTYIKAFDDYIVASIEDIPLANNSVDFIICVGSVLNYTDYHKSLNEFSRILRTGGKIILKFERSNSGEFLFTKKHNKEIIAQKYHYNNQEHLLWLYNEHSIIAAMKYCGFKIKKRERFHVFSTLLNRLGLAEKKAAKWIKQDWLLFPFSYFLAHNCILFAEKTPNK